MYIHFKRGNTCDTCVRKNTQRKLKPSPNVMSLVSNQKLVGKLFRVIFSAREIEVNQASFSSNLLCHIKRECTNQNRLRIHEVKMGMIICAMASKTISG